MTFRQSPLREEHVQLGAKFTEFGGWEMPLSYPQGTIAEHLACRQRAVAFDVSHLGSVRVTGDRAFTLLQESFTNDLNRIAAGRAQYTHLLDDGDGSVVDDCIIWWVDSDTFDVMPNASNTQGVIDVIGGEDITGQRAIIAVQGPRARAVMGSVSPDAAEVPHFGVRRFSFGGETCVVAGTGYTGEDGVECAVPNSVAPQFWRAVLHAGAEPAGLGARDTLRLEAGLPLHSHELGPGITPLQAGLNWVVAWDKETFRGRDALLAEKQRGPARRLRGLVASGRRPPRNGDPCLVAGEVAGYVTSGNFSPILERGIALALLPPDLALGSSVEVDAHGNKIAAVVTTLPFYKRDTESARSAN